VIQIFVPGHFVRNVFPAANAVKAFVTRERPICEGIAPAEVCNVVAELIRARKCSLLALHEAIGISGTCNFCFASKNTCNGLISVFIYVETKPPRAVEIKGKVWRINFEYIITAVAALTEKQRTHRKS